MIPTVIIVHYLPHPSSASLTSLRQKLLESRLINNNVTDRLQPLPTSLLLLQQLPSSRDITSVQLGQHVLSERLDGFASDDASAGGSLDDDLCFESLAHLP